jgi:excisionase family DNA binding protein
MVAIWVCRRSEITIYACSIAYVITPAYGVEWSSTTMNKFALTVVEAAEAASISRTKVYSEIRTGRLKAIKIGGSTRVRLDDLRAWLESCPVIVPSAAYGVAASKTDEAARCSPVTPILRSKIGAALRRPSLNVEIPVARTRPNRDDATK